MNLPLNSKGREVAVDQRCWDLAETFLAEFNGKGTAKEHIADLAEDIQRCCEDAYGDAEQRRRRIDRAAGLAI